MKEKAEGRLRERPAPLCFALFSEFFTYALLVSPHSQSDAEAANLFTVNVTLVEDFLLFTGLLTVAAWPRLSINAWKSILKEKTEDEHMAKPTFTPESPRKGELSRQPRSLSIRSETIKNKQTKKLPTGQGITDYPPCSGNESVAGRD